MLSPQVTTTPVGPFRLFPSPLNVIVGILGYCSTMRLPRGTLVDTKLQLYYTLVVLPVSLGQHLMPAEWELRFDRRIGNLPYYPTHL